jgi:hypothetical protein
VEATRMKKIEDDLGKKWKMTTKENGRQPKKYMDLRKKKWKTT